MTQATQTNIVPQVAPPLMASLYNRMAAAGFSKWFVQSVALPSWWNDSLAETETGFAHAALLIGRHLGVDVASLLDPKASVVLTPIGQVRFKANVVPEKLRSVTSVAVQAARLLSKATPVAIPSDLPKSALELRATLISRGEKVITLDSLLAWCWEVGIPVLHLKELPGKKPQALCLRIAGRPVIFLCDKHDWSAWQAFHLAHELGHICRGHLDDNNSFLMDETIRRDDPSEYEKEANAFAVELLLGDPDIKIAASDKLTASQLAHAVTTFGKDHSLDPGALVLNIFYHDGANRIGRNTNAVKLLETHPPAITRINLAAKSNLDWDEISDDDAEFLMQFAGLNEI